MSSFEDVDNAVLGELIHEIDAIEFEFADADNPVVLKDGDGVRLDPLAGGDLRQALIGAYGDARYRFSMSDTSVKKTSTETGFVERMIYEELERQVSEVDDQLALAVEGLDYYQLGASGDCIGAVLLQEDERLFGNLAGVKVTEFLTLCPGGVNEDGSRIIEPKPEHLWGGMVLLKDVELCEKDGAGIIRNSFTQVSLPIHPNGFNWLLLH